MEWGGGAACFSKGLPIAGNVQIWAAPVLGHARQGRAGYQSAAQARRWGQGGPGWPHEWCRHMQAVRSLWAGEPNTSGSSLADDSEAEEECGVTADEPETTERRRRPPAIYGTRCGPELVENQVQDIERQTVTASRRHPCDHSESRSSSGPLAAHGPLAGPTVPRPAVPSGHA